MVTDFEPGWVSLGSVEAEALLDVLAEHITE